MILTSFLLFLTCLSVQGSKLKFKHEDLSPLIPKFVEANIEVRPIGAPRPAEIIYNSDVPINQRKRSRDEKNLAENSSKIASSPKIQMKYNGSIPGLLLMERVTVIPDENSQIEVKLVNPAFQEFIDMEVRSQNFRLETRIFQYKQLITCIANNNIVDYYGNKQYFFDVFKKHCESYKNKNGNLVMPFYIIYFGATNFYHLLDGMINQIVSTELNYSDAFRNCISLNDIDNIVKIMKYSFLIPENNHIALIEQIRRKYPSLHYLNFIYFETINYRNNREDALKIFQAPDEESKLVHLKTFLTNNLQADNETLSHFSYKRLIEIPNFYPIFTQNLPNDLKFLIAKISIIHSSHPGFLKIFTSNRDIMVNNYMDKLINTIVSKNRFQFIQIIYSLIDNLFSPRMDGRPSIYEYLISFDNVNIIKAFESTGLIPEVRVIDGKNTIQLAHQYGYQNLIEYFNQKYSAAKINSYINELQ